MNDSPPNSTLSKAEILIAGPVRNCERALRREVLRLQAAFQGAGQLYWFIVESDSTDRTLEVLASLEREIPNFRFRSLGFLAGSIRIREACIAHCRNAYLDELDSNPLYAKVDFVVVADLDGVNSLLTPGAVASCWSRSDWDVCTANQRGPYYDLWALRHPVWNPSDCWKQCDMLRQYGIQSELAAWASVYGKMVTIPQDSDWIPVDSAFGGLGVYRRPILSGVRYAGADEKGTAICEHVWLHNQLRARGARILINPRLINASVTDHSRERSVLRTLRRGLIGLLPRKALIFFSACKKFLRRQKHHPPNVACELDR